MNIDQNNVVIIFLLALTLMALYSYSRVSERECDDDKDNIENFKVNDSEELKIMSEAQQIVDIKGDNLIIYTNNAKQQETFEHNLIKPLINKMNIEGKYMIYMTPINSNRYDNNDLLNLIEYISKRNNGVTKTYINWIWNHRRFTDNNLFLFKRYDQYHKFFKIPYEADDYDKPLLNMDHGELMKETGQSTYESPMNITTKICVDNIFDHSSDKEISCDNGYTRYNGGIFVARYYIIIAMKDKPAVVHTEDATVHVAQTRQLRLLSELTPSIRLNWNYLTDRIGSKLTRLQDLIIRESELERKLSEIQPLIDKSRIELYQLFAVDVVIKNGEPYVYKVNAFSKLDEWTTSPKVSEFYKEILMQIINVLEIR